VRLVIVAAFSSKDRPEGALPLNLATKVDDFDQHLHEGHGYHLTWYGFAVIAPLGATAVRLRSADLQD
jgi:cytochrome oxidase assembly protein ShyY1